MEKCLLILNASLYDETMLFKCNQRENYIAGFHIYFQRRYRCIDATDFSMFSLALMLPMSDARIGRTLIIY